jgi:hypothetical protein
VAFLLAVLATMSIYWPGLAGSYFFDDYPNIVNNTRLHVNSMHWREWQQAIWSSPATDLRRPLATLTFAANYFFGGLAPQPMKAVNLGIHLLNGWLLYLLLLKIAERSAFGPVIPRNHLIAVLTAATWLVHPINLTTVLYVVQREENLANVFVLAGLWVYLDARARQHDGKPGGTWRLWIGVPLMTALGALSKESAILLPLYALVLELVILRKPRSKPSREIVAFFLAFLVVPFAFGLAWLLPKVLSPLAYSARPFTLLQRLFTEPRVILDYIDWILVPTPGKFSFYHDTIPVSFSLLEPWTTIPAILVLAVAFSVGLLLKRRRPLAALGILWFFSAHALTATIIPLELAFEHRNYFATAGLLLAAYDLILPQMPGLARANARYVAIAAFLALCCFTTFLRAKEWSNPLSLAMSEVARHPDSARATYEYGRTLVLLSDYNPESPLVPKAVEALSTSSRIPGSGILPDVGLIMLASRTGRAVETIWWQTITSKLSQHQTSAADGEALKSLTLCQREGRCVVDDDRMLDVYLAAVGSGNGTASSLYSYAIFAFGRLHDSALALRLAQEAADKSAGDPQYRLNLVDLLISLGRKDEALAQLTVVKQQDRHGSLELEIEKRQELLDNKH